MKDVAITTYVDNNTNCVTEFGWLHKSWLYSKSNEMSDIIAFCHPGISAELNIKYPGIITVPLEPLSEKDATWKEYKFINSIYYLTTPAAAAALSNYQYVLRTDGDVFLTPNFKNLRPRLATFGIGLYANDYTVAKKLIEIAEKWKITPVLNNVGSTIMALKNAVLQYNQLHFSYCKKLRQDEFPDGYGTWPGWFMGVLTMYAGQLSANHYFGTGMVTGGLDVHCMAHAEMCNTDYHIHAWHTYDYFSKFKWRKGAYGDLDVSTSTASLAAVNKNCIADYCLFIAGNKP